MNSLLLGLVSFSNAWWPWLAHAAWQSALVGLLLLGVVWLMRRKSAPSRHGVLVVALLKFAMPPLFIVSYALLPALPMDVPAAPRVMQSGVPATNGAVKSAVTPKTSSALAASKGIEPAAKPSASPSSTEHSATTASPGLAARLLGQWRLLLFAAHLFGGLAVAGLILVGISETRRFVRRCEAAKDGAMLQAFQDVRSRLGVRRSIQLLLSSENCTPVAVGILRPSVILPKSLVEQMDSARLEAVLAHELAHHQRGDLWIMTIESLLMVVWWFHPVFWLVRRELRAVREDCCDDILLEARVADSETYCEILLQAAGHAARPRRAQAALGIAERFHPLGRRFMRIMDAPLVRKSSLSRLGLAMLTVLALVLWPGVRFVAGTAEAQTAPPAEVNQPTPPPNDDGSVTPSTPPEGWVWWGSIGFRKDAKIQSNYQDTRGTGYGVPVQYTNGGTLIVASKYPDHTACIWSYDTVTAQFSVLHRKTREAMGKFLEHEAVAQLLWTEFPREYTWERNKENGKFYREGAKGAFASLRGGVQSNDFYISKPYSEDNSGLVFKSKVMEGVLMPLNGGALELIQTITDSSVAIPFVEKRYAKTYVRSISLYDPVTKRTLSSMPADGLMSDHVHRDLGQGLAMIFCIDAGSGRGGVADTTQRIVLMTYPELRVVARGDLPRSDLQIMPSVKDKLAMDIILDNYWANVEGGTPVPGKVFPVPNQKLFRVRVPDTWRDAPGQKNTTCIWEDPPKDLAALEVAELGAFDVAKYDAHWLSKVESDTGGKNITPSYVWRDGMMYWRKRHTGEVVMAAIADLDAQTVIGGAGTAWDGFRLNPARDELVTWRENGEIVFWKVPFPAAEAVYKGRVVTDETPHRLEQM
jgi:beta-lactamase regulating signal transducer with metallopeptidase domain